MIKNKAVYLEMGIHANGHKEIFGVVDRTNRGR